LSTHPRLPARGQCEMRMVGRHTHTPLPSPHPRVRVGPGRVKEFWPLGVGFGRPKHPTRSPRTPTRLTRPNVRARSAGVLPDQHVQETRPPSIVRAVVAGPTHNETKAFDAQGWPPDARGVWSPRTARCPHARRDVIIRLSSVNGLGRTP
jgi:hypothetical protein